MQFIMANETHDDSVMEKEHKYEVMALNTKGTEKMIWLMEKAGLSITKEMCMKGTD